MRRRLLNFVKIAYNIKVAVTMAGILSPRSRNLSDSMDYDDELAELHDRRQSSLGIDRIDRHFRCSPNEARYHDNKMNETDEDTEDASEDGDARQDEHQEIKEQ